MKKRLFTNLILYLFIITLTFSMALAQEGDKNDPKGGKQAYLFGKNELRAKNYEKAHELFSKAILMDPELVDAYHMKAKAANGAGELEKDIKVYEREIKMLKKGEDYHTRFGLGCCYLVKSENLEGIKEQAREELSQVLILDKDGPFAEKAKELAEEYGISLEKPPFNIMDYLWIIIAVAAVILIVIIILIVMMFKSAPKFAGVVMITSPQGQILFNSKLEALPKKDKSCVKIGSDMGNDIILSEGNISSLHARLIPIKHNKKDMVRIMSEAQSKITRESGGKGEQVYEDILWDQDTFKIDNYTLTYSNPVTGPRPVSDMMGGGMGLPTPPAMGGLPTPPAMGGLPTPPAMGGLPTPGMKGPAPGMGLVPPPPKKSGPPAGGGDIPGPPPTASSDDGFSF